MTYATFTDVVVRYRPITTMIGSQQFDVATNDVSSVFLPSAASLVDAYIGMRYATPLADPVPPIITQVTADLAIHEMLAEKTPVVPEFIDKRYNRCLAILADLRDGKMTLGNSVAVVTSGDSFAWSTRMNTHPIFEPTINIEDQTVDQPTHDAQESLRTGDTGAGGIGNTNGR